MPLADVPLERAILAAICHYGKDAYIEVCDIIYENSFTIESNSIIYKCLKVLLDDDSTAKIDVPSLHSVANKINLGYFFQNKTETDYIRALFNFPVAIENIKKYAAILRKLHIARDLCYELDLAKKEILEVSGKESISKILSIAEDKVLDFGINLNADSKTEILSKDIDDIFKQIETHPVEQLGIPTGYQRYDEAIGGGLRPGTINVIAARMKSGKTWLADNIGLHIAKNLGLPVLNLDTEMLREDHLFRCSAILADINALDIESGKYTFKSWQKDKINKAIGSIKKMPLYHRSIGGMSLEEQLSEARRWLYKYVGINPDGTVKPCVIIYDYIKLMSANDMSGNLQEYQALGYLMTNLHNFAVKYRLPILAFAQASRSGISNESTDIIAGSDRILWLCSNCGLFKKKSDEEIAEDGVDAGNRKMVILASRHGVGLKDKEYINFTFGFNGKIVENSTNFNKNTTKDTGFIVDHDDGQPTPIL